LENSALSENQRALVEHLIVDEFNDIFAVDAYDLGKCTLKPYNIETPENVEPIRQRAYRLPFYQREVLRKEIDTLLQKGIIRESTSPWSSPCMMVPKADSKELRLVCDFRKVNMAVKPDAYPLPCIRNIFDSLTKSKFFTTMDVARGFWQIPLTENQVK
jgi:hypothetical protein